MINTSPEIERQYRAMLLQRSGEERLKISYSMHAMAQALARASVLEKDPLASPSSIRRTIFLRFYKNDFALDTREKILRALEKCLIP